ncbi:MAG: HipA domain-containing protein, partial [Clostridia bacterium]|nr:HipA domain-containing protein [Clostridia bacterium]
LIFNFLSGNCDAHAKNYAVLYRNGQPSFAPAYDLLSTMVYDSIAKRFAMSIGGETRMGAVTKGHFAELARRCDLNPKMVLSELSETAKALPQAARKLAEELNAIHPSGIYESIAWEIGKLCRQILG